MKGLEGTVPPPRQPFSSVDKVPFQELKETSAHIKLLTFLKGFDYYSRSFNIS